jgi:hypothetical protein
MNGTDRVREREGVSGDGGGAGGRRPMGRPVRSEPLLAA